MVLLIRLGAYIEFKAFGSLDQIWLLKVQFDELRDARKPDAWIFAKHLPNKVREIMIWTDFLSVSAKFWLLEVEV